MCPAVQHLVGAVQAAVYRNEEEVGQALRESGVDRASVFLVTKIAPGDQGEEAAYRAAVASLAKLGVDYVDLLLIHWPGAAGVSPLQYEGSVLPTWV